jgi:hypothetical protein
MFYFQKYRGVVIDWWMYRPNACEPPSVLQGIFYVEAVDTHGHTI